MKLVTEETFDIDNRRAYRVTKKAMSILLIDKNMS